MELAGCVIYAFQLIRRAIGKIVVIVGLGPAGLSAVQIASPCGTMQITEIDTS